MPKGGFGNLIALPLQKDRVHRGEAFLLILISSLILINGLFLHR